ncbi:hypothetical protein AWZ03_015089, partial [Drosophila navojoa]
LVISQHITNHEELLLGTILLNNFDGTIYIYQEKPEREGTFLIQASNATINSASEPKAAFTTCAASAFPRSQGTTTSAAGPAAMSETTTTNHSGTSNDGSDNNNKPQRDQLRRHRLQQQIAEAPGLLIR